MYLLILSMKMEIWKDVKDYEGFYKISNYGNVKSKSYKGEKILKPASLKNGYLNVVLCVNQIKKHKLIHRLVAEAFIENLKNLPQVNHKDFNKSNNHVNNLEWCSVEYNNSYTIQHDKIQKYENRPMAKLTKEKVLSIPNLINLGATTEDLSNYFKVSRRCIDNIFEGKNWKGLGIDFTKIKPNKKIKNINSKFRLIPC